jgi:hypothetical protein
MSRRRNYDPTDRLPYRALAAKPWFEESLKQNNISIVIRCEVLNSNGEVVKTRCGKARARFVSQKKA